MSNEGRLQQVQGFTLLELMLVITIVAVLATLAEPIWQQATIKAKEAALKQTLFTVRDVIDQYRADHGKYPPALEDLAKDKYLRKIPEDPFTRSPTTWQEITDEAEGGIVDIHSGSPLVGLRGTPYNEW
jgi:general secretion pathway protein G